MNFADRFRPSSVRRRTRRARRAPVAAATLPHASPSRPWSGAISRRWRLPAFRSTSRQPRWCACWAPPAARPLLRLAAGIERPTSGRVLINDSEVAGPARFVAPEKRRRPDVPGFRAFPALEHTRQRCLRPQVASQGGCPPRGACAALARVGLERYAQAYPTSSPAASSSAWALARAIVPRPAVMLMDRGRSSNSTCSCASGWRDAGAAARDARHLPDRHPRPGRGHPPGGRIAVMQAGRLVQAGKAEALYRNPADLFVAPPSPRSTRSRSTSRAALRADRHLCRAGPRRRRRGDPVHPPPGHSARGRRSGVAGAGVARQVSGDLAVLEIAAQGFERPLLTLVREWEVPERGQEVSIAVDPESVLVFPPRAPRE